ncbi:MAG: L-threonine synthase [Acidobacteriaceae bacterium]|nr:L-threonine synthase [Acidobacteriaceae bacterium]
MPADSEEAGVTHLHCTAEGCGATFDLHTPLMACPRCGELLEVAVDRPELEPAALKRLWLERRCSFAAVDQSGVWRFREALPQYPAETVVTLREGNVAMVRAHRAADFADVSRLHFKHLGWNPTGCFKDLGMTTGMTEARHLGAKVVACASTGNTAASLAAYAARAGIVGRVYLPAGQVSMNKLAQALDFGAEIVEVNGSFDDALNTLLALPPEEVYFLNSVNPFRIEGQKTCMYEVLEERGWRAPDYLVVPGGNLGNSASFGKAFDELLQWGLIERAPKLIVVQAAGANPFARLWRERAKHPDAVLQPLEPETRATAIRIGNPRSWRKALHGVKTTGGMVIDVTDEEIAAAKAAIGGDGIGCEPASATTLAGLKKLRTSGVMERDAEVVAMLTGHGLKDTAYILEQHGARGQGQQEGH